MKTQTILAVMIMLSACTAQAKPAPPEPKCTKWIWRNATTPAKYICLHEESRPRPTKTRN